MAAPRPRLPAPAPLGDGPQVHGRLRAPVRGSTRHHPRAGGGAPQGVAVHPLSPSRRAVTGSRDRAVLAFEERFGAAPTHLAWGPGRVNLIGEHTDYNDGFVLPLALERRAWLALTPRDDGVVRLVAEDLGEEGEFRLGDLGPETPARASAAAGPGQATGWLEYPRGVAWSLSLEGAFRDRLQGFDGVMASDVPRGAGLSSSAA